MPGSEARADRAFERLYRRHVTDVHRYASAVLGNPADAEDVAQTVFMNAYRAFCAGERPEQPLNWLITITHNVCRQRFRDVARRPREVMLDAELASDPLGQGETKYRSEDIARALTQLSLNQRAALALRELEGRSYGDIASILGMSTSAVETLLFRARRAFREQLEGSLTCSEAERAISLQLDGMLERKERGGLRAHLRSCPECASLARRFRAQRSALQGIALVPLPSSLAGGFGAGGGAAVGTALGLKAAAFGTAAVLAVGVGTTELVRHTRTKHAPTPPKAGGATTEAEAQLVSGAPTSTSVAVWRDSGETAAASPAMGTATRPARPAAKPSGSSVPPSESVTTASAPSSPADADPTPAQAADVHTETAARPQPQQSGGGGSPAKEQDLKAKEHGPPAQPGRPEDPGSNRGQGNDPQKAEHPEHPDHPAGPDHPGAGGPPGQEEAGQPDPDPQPIVTAPELPVDPPADPPADVPNVPPGKVDPPGQHDPPGKKRDLIPPLFG